MAYKDNLQLEVSDNCRIVLRNGFAYMGHLRRWNSSDAMYPGGNWTWVFLPKAGHRKTYTSNGFFRLSCEACPFDIVDFQIGTKPT